MLLDYHNTKRAGLECSIPNSFNKDNSHVSSQQALAIDMYSASADEQDTVSYFLDFQDIKESPKNTHNPEIDHLVSEQVPQSSSENTKS